jgi:hypothetical protein
MSRGDFFLCSSQEQRFYYLGWLTALGRVNPLALESDPTLERLIAELPFGTPDELPPQPPPRDDILTECGDASPLLYFGGVYDWYDRRGPLLRPSSAKRNAEAGWVPGCGSKVGARSSDVSIWPRCATWPSLPTGQASRPISA